MPTLSFSTMPVGSRTEVVALFLVLGGLIWITGSLLFRTVRVYWRSLYTLARWPKVKSSASRVTVQLFREQVVCLSVAIPVFLLLVAPERWSLAVRPGDPGAFQFALIFGLMGALVFIVQLVLGPLENLERYVGSVKKRGGVDPLAPFALYLRDHAGESRAREETSVSAPDGVGTTHNIPHQVAATRLEREFGAFRVPLYGIWNPFADVRRNLPFVPLLSHDDTWREDVARLSNAAVVVVIDAERISSGVAWEIELILASSLAQKCLVISCEDDEYSPSLCRLYSNARWHAVVEGRGTSTAPHDRRLELPAELADYLEQHIGAAGCSEPDNASTFR
jgi:hypothetical protein